ncbi:MAG: hypothetical protein FWF91_05225 [Coriobacteriia bacterium]|nr:hypothetical protein [Coriobacteriia bacterium]
MEDKRDIFILLTKHSDRFSHILVSLIRGYYSHASIGFEEEKGCFYSFTRRGFLVEEPEKICLKKINVPCALYRVPVSHRAYDSMKEYIESHYKSYSGWKFNVSGAILGGVGFPFLRRSRKRFCSQFVAEVLEAGKAVPLHKRSSLFMPDDFTRTGLTGPEFSGTLEGLEGYAY